MASETYECQTYEYRETIYGRASRGRLRTMYHDECGSRTTETVGVAHTPYGTVEVSAAIWWDGVQTLILCTVRNGVLYRRWERRRRPLSERGLTTLARRWAQSLVAKDTEVSGDALLAARNEIARLTRELENARTRLAHIEREVARLVDAEVISEGKAREILGVGVDEWREIEDRTLGAGTDT